MTTKDVPGLRERSKARRRRHILHTALRLFVEHGYEGTTIADIAEAADVAPRTVTGYFPSKLDFITEWPAEREQRLIALYYDDPSVDFVELVDKWWRDLRDHLDHEEATLTRAMALANPGVVALAEVEVSRRIAGAEFPFDGTDQEDPFEVAGRAAIRGVNRAFERGVAEGRMTDRLHEDLLNLIRSIAETTHVGHGALKLDR
ncbi:helix-turn-helix domain containing protein [Streptomyces sp. NBS 14/10]|uniref:TetR/AcrR family transcriptional regulator n=1 Tax=Streptomyces sp. NBS 14/10 TaxID=1945643 RepID=UPI000B9D185A|nr:TetR/AcrR family transcriptional regulator [Streptomyces sp. NBS 14/10]KAK1182253.1 helix-turn-helix domain containing protein [Streptomyces sp. NBS 14/10]